MEQTRKKEGTESEKSTSSTLFTRSELISFAIDVGFSVALPLAGFVFVGHLTDQALGTKPMFIIIGLLLSLIVTTITIARKVSKFNK